MGAVIKQALIEDARSISKIHASSWKKGYQGMVPQQYLDNLKDDFWVATFQNSIGNNLFEVKIIYDNDLPVGCISYGKSRDEKLTLWGEIIALYIHPDYFRKGYGEQLLNVALTELRSVGYKNCYLWVLKANTNARNFYEKNGFTYSEDEDCVELMGEKLTDIRYVINLTQDIKLSSR